MANGALGAGVLGGVIGAVLGAGAMLAWPQRPDAGAAAAPAKSSETLRRAFDEALAPVVAELRAARLSETGSGDSGGSRTTRSDSSSQPIEAPSTAPPIIARGIADDGLARDELRPAGVRWTPEPRLARLRDLRGFMDDGSVRQRWIFTGQREALAWFGTPTLVQTPGGSEEIWEYELPGGVDEDGDETTVTWRLMFIHGRLAQVYDDE